MTLANARELFQRLRAEMRNRTFEPLEAEARVAEILALSRRIAVAEANGLPSLPE